MIKSIKIILMLGYAILVIMFSFVAFANDLLYEDKIVAIVNQNIIKLSDLVKIENYFINNFIKNKINVPDKFVLRTQLLDQMIDCELIKQESNKIGILVDDNKLNTVIAGMADDYKLTLDLFKSKVEIDDSTPWDIYLYNVRNAIYFNSLKQHLVEEKLQIIDLDIDSFLSDLNNGNKSSDNFLKNRKSYKNLYSLSQILFKPSQNFSDKIVDDSYEILKEIRDRLISGENFNDLSVEFSNNSYLSFINFLGTKPLDCWPELFVKAIEDLDIGQVSEIFRSPSGFHIIKINDINPCNIEGDDILFKKFNQILDRKESDSIIQKEVQHILIKFHKIFNEKETINKLENIRYDIISGKENFNDMAYKYSEDVTASQGGNIGWITPGSIIKELDHVINNLDPGQISSVVKSSCGYHLIKVNDVRKKDLFDENKRIRAREYLIELNAQYIFDNWLKNLKTCSFIENRL
ncbi:peptidyl-prolyl cis-trans isomerase SurA [Candidatus Kinetoplastibacterium oncopeltii TCC290E]|uniref:Chaperone SurA n=1 Tax=Candidatus Kinetoplastidibacterium stringomonadis TCC290E TaxID=1208920 RepID=M1LRD5_9PROT|nr:peptidylprolyl isomerase [Candidatus Kinetoplastibacterium oncopeltii]AGF48132.1 peptidyl-prolyl cis-trans isomerase SurA [Candidatus Kinetoplastibacterium oncopeltii TCC290E]